MSLVVTCRCGKQYATQPHLAGQQVQCPACGAAIQIPFVASAAVSPLPSGIAPQRTAPHRTGGSGSAGQKALIVILIAIASTFVVACAGLFLIPFVRGVKQGFQRTKLDYEKSKVWQTYYSPRGKFEVMLPGNARQKDDPYELQGNRDLERDSFYAMTSDGTFYSVLARINLPPAPNAKDAHEWTLQLVELQKQSNPGLKYTTSTWNGTTIHEFEGPARLEDQTVQIRERHFAIGGIAYKLHAFSSRGQPMNPLDLGRFLNSFKIRQ